MIVNYLHQRLPVPMAVPECDGQVMVLGFSKFRSRQELSFLFSSKNTSVQLFVNCSVSFQIIKSQ